MATELESDILHQVLQRVYKMRIAICDDENHFRDDIRKAVYAYSNAHRLEAVVNDYVCGEALLKSANKYDIILLDQQMSGMNGLDVARIIRESDINCVIIFITSYPDFVYDSFEVSTYRFLTKPLDITKLYKALDDYFLSFGNDYPIMLKQERDTVCVQVRDIVYLEADGKKCHINLADKQYHCARTMAATAMLLPKSIFYRVHRSYIVNFNYIHSYDNRNIRLKNGEIVFMSRKYFPHFKNAFRTFAKNRSI